MREYGFECNMNEKRSKPREEVARNWNAKRKTSEGGEPRKPEAHWRKKVRSNKARNKQLNRRRHVSLHQPWEIRKWKV
jgi:hypothetical protein